MRPKVLMVVVFGAVSILSSGSTASADSSHGDHEEHEDEGGHHSGKEGLIILAPEARETSGIGVREAGRTTLKTSLAALGRLVPISSKTVHVTPRFAGVVREVRKEIGDEVKAGDVLAIVESNQNLQPFEVKTLRPGIITARHASLGEFAEEGAELFVVMDLTDLWADLTVFERDASKVQLGQQVVVSSSGESQSIHSRVSFISPVVDEVTQSRIVRATVPNPDKKLAPGAFIEGSIVLDEFQVPVAVSNDAVQTVNGKPSVFVVDGEGFSVRPIVTGRSDRTHTEVLSGLKGGERYATTNSFVLKAELGKSEAAHDH